jgi:hypothetical protein
MPKNNLENRMTRRGLFASLGTGLSDLVTKGKLNFAVTPNIPSVLLHPEAVVRKKRGRNGS